MDKELRSVTMDDAELRAETVDGKVRLTGYAAVYNKRSQDLGGFEETIKPGAFDAVLRSNPDVIAAFNHDSSQLLGRTTSGTLRLSSNSRGLKYEIDLPETRQDIAELVQRGDLRGSSFAFTVGKDGDSWEFGGDFALRTINTVAGLYDVGPVTHPAYLDTTVAMRSMDAIKPKATRTSCDWLTLRLKLVDK